MFVTIDKDKCVGCNACIRACPLVGVNRAERSGTKSIIAINTEACISCGECIKECEHNARTYIDDTERFFEDLARGKEITLVVAPAFRITEKQADKALNALKKLGVKAVYDVGFGADICTYMHLKAVETNKVGKIISQPCAAVTEYILKYKQSLIPYLSPVHSPISCMAIFLKKTVGVTGSIACISPCIAKKQEFEETGTVDYNVTFARLMEYLEKNNHLTGVSDEFKYDNLPAYCGKIYPRPGGLKACLEFKRPDLKVVTSEGVNRVYDELDIYESTPDAYKPDVFDVLSCGEGCVEGPATRYNLANLLEYKQMTGTLELEAFKARSKQTKFKIDKQYKFFSKLNINDYLRRYAIKRVSNMEVSKAALEDAYSKLLKFTDIEKNFDCRACGYKSCKAMATAIALGLNTEHNCHQYVAKVSEKEQDELQEKNLQIESKNQIITDAVTEIIASVESIGGSSSSLAEYCDENKASMDEMLSEVRSVLEQCDKISEALEGIELVNKKYQAVTDTILDITEQTHILSINASVEAARAGSAGSAFAVVAQEIRTLAENTKRATDGVAEDDEATRAYTERVKVISSDIVTMLQKLAKIVTELQDNMGTLISTGEEINQGVQEISRQANNLNVSSN